MLARVAERMYWGGRYLERAENTARLVNTYAAILLDLPEETGVGWAHLLQILAAQESFKATKAKRAEQAILKYLIADPDNPASILSSLEAARENFRTSRDVVPKEGWECVNELCLMGRRDLPAAAERRRRFDTLSDCVGRCQQITGLLSGTMSHGDAYNFMRMGHYLERADMTSRVVDIAAAMLARGNPSLAPYENALWMAVLKSLSAYQMYRRYVRRRIASSDVATFLLADAQFPRSVAHVLDELTICLEKLPPSHEAATVLAGLKERVPSDTVPKMDVAALHEYIDHLQIGLAKLDHAIQSEWFLGQQQRQEQ